MSGLKGKVNKYYWNFVIQIVMLLYIQIVGGVI